MNLTGYALKVIESAYSHEVGAQFILTGKTAVIGREEGCDVRLADVLVSQRHAAIVASELGPFVEDRGSSNGVWVDEEQVSRYVLDVGQRFRVGTTILELIEAGTDQEAGTTVETAGPVTAVGSSLFGEGEPVPASGNNPVVLDDPSSAWIVENGKVEVFTVELKDGEPVGPRSHYLTVEPGEAFFGMDLESYGLGYGFIAVGKMGTVLRRVSVRRLEALANAGIFATEITKLVDLWVRGLSRSLTEEIIPGPVSDVNLAVEQQVSMEQGQKASASKGVLWLDVERGELLYIGMENIGITARELFPVTPESWIEASNEFGVHTDLTAAATSEVVGERALWRGLGLFHRVLCQCEFINKRLAVVDEFQRLKTKAEYSKAAREAAMKRLAAVLSDEAIEVAEPPSEEEPDSTYRAMRLVGESLGIQIKSHPSLNRDLLYDDRVSIIARASAIRVRKVVLRDEWWKLDQGPILARREDEGPAVALIPASPGSYDLVDPADGSREKVTEEVADTLSPFGHVLYRSFPDGPLSVKSLIRFGTRGMAPDFLKVAVVGVVVGVLGTVTPFFTGRVYDAAIPAAERGLLTQFILALVVAALVSSAFRVTQEIAMLRVQGKMDYSVQAALWDRLLDLPSNFFREYSAGDLANRAAGINAIRGLIAGVGISSILGVFSGLFYVVLMFTYSTQLAVLAIGLTILFVGFTTTANYIQLRHQRVQFERQGKLSGLVLQLISGVAKLRVAGAEQHAFRVWAEKFSEMRRTNFMIGRVQNAVAVFGSMFPIFSSMAIFYLLVALRGGAPTQALAGALTTGQFIAFSSAYGLFAAAVGTLSGASLSMLAIVPIYERLKPIITTPAETDETKAYPGRLSGRIELSHLHFRYVKDGPWTIKDLTLSIEPGEFVAFVGPSGSGKSTVMRLMLGFEVPEKGSVYYDGQDLGNLDLRETRQQMGVVLQESRVFPAELYRNIVGSTSRTIEEAWEAAEMAGLADDIREMPMGMHTYVSEGGGGLSGGQRQRLLISRAVVNRPRIIFMDEATSALDNRTQAIVTESLDSLQATRIVIAHRLSTIINADRICYLEAGELKEVGTYDELMKLDGKFAQLAKRQLA
jgi:ATP-binding cassette subfamily C protein